MTTYLGKRDTSSEPRDNRGEWSPGSRPIPNTPSSCDNCEDGDHSQCTRPKSTHPVDKFGNGGEVAQCCCSR
jgi:hypothetical protein